MHSSKSSGKGGDRSAYYSSITICDAGAEGGGGDVIVYAYMGEVRVHTLGCRLISKQTHDHDYAVKKRYLAPWRGLALVRILPLCNSFASRVITTL